MVFRKKNEIVNHQNIILDVIQTFVLVNLLSEGYHVHVERALNSLIYLKISIEWKPNKRGMM